MERGMEQGARSRDRNHEAKSEQLTGKNKRSYEFSDSLNHPRPSQGTEA
jgi:hypothetical protein